MEADRNKLYDSAQFFFDDAGSGAMKLSPEAAIEVCRAASSRGLVVARVEGGIWHHPGFEARLDCIWDGADPPLEQSEAEVNNRNAANFIREERGEHDAFVITAPPQSGWPHRAT
jgi:hypothetical protein